MRDSSGKTLDEYLTDLTNAHLAIDPAWSCRAVNTRRAKDGN